MKKTILAILVVLTILPATTSAATHAELLAQKDALLRQVIALLQIQIKHLQQQLALQQGSVLGVSTTTASTTSEVIIKKKRRGGGGGGGRGGGSNTPAALSLEISGSDNAFTVTSNQPISPTGLSLQVTEVPIDAVLPTSFTVIAELNDGSTQEITLNRIAETNEYSGAPAPLTINTYTGSFLVVTPEELFWNDFDYQVTYSGNGTTRSVSLTYEGHEALLLLTDSIEMNTDTSGANDEIAEFYFEFSLQAINEDFYVAEQMKRYGEYVSRGIAYEVDGPESANIQTVAVVYPEATTEDGSIQVQEGTQQFQVQVTLRTDTTGQYRVRLSEINYSPFSDTLTGIETIVPDPFTLLRSQYVAVTSSGTVTPDEPSSEDPNATTTQPLATYLKINESNNNPETQYIEVEDDQDTTGITLLEATIEPEVEDIAVNRMLVKIETPDAVTEDVLDEVRLIILDTTIQGNKVDDLYPAEDIAWYEFDTSILGTLEEDVTFAVEVTVDVNEQEGNYTNFQRISASISEDETAEWAASSNDGDLDSDALIGTVNGVYHILVIGGLIIDDVQTSARAEGANDSVGVFEIELEVLAVEADVYFTDNVFTGADAATDGFGVEIEGGTGIISYATSFTGDEETPGVYMVREGESEVVTIYATIDPVDSGSFRLHLKEFNFSLSNDGVSDVQPAELSDPTDFRTQWITVQGSH